MATKLGLLPESWAVGKSHILDSWPLYGDPTAVALILVAYVSFAVYFGPKFMAKRKPFNLKYLIISYNAILVYYNLWSLKEATTDPIFWKYLLSFGCAQITPEEEQAHQLLLCSGYWHLGIVKLMDLLDTVFFVLSKKQSHVSFLHVQHHTLSVAILWFSGKYFLAPELAFSFLLNTAVHVMMYFYYFVAALGPQYRKYLWWKRYLTIVQIVQFLIILAYMIPSLWLSCGYDQRIVYVVILNVTLNLALFLNFYFKTYDTNEKTAKVK